MISDETLMTRVIQRDQTAMELLYDRYAAIVLGALMHLVNDRAAAEDLLLETFWQVWQGAAAYPMVDGPFTNWLLRIARRLALDPSQRQTPRLQVIAQSTDTNRGFIHLHDSNEEHL